jgi:DNA-binding transcriptional regulator YiaG
MDAALAGPPLDDAERLLRLVRRMHPTELADTFRRELSDPELLGVIGALPAKQRHALAARARLLGQPDAGGQPASGPQADRPLATAIRTARQQAQISQQQLARLVGVRQPTVSQWERGVTEPAALHMAALLRVLPSLADMLDPQLTPTARGQPPTTRAS